MKHLHDKVLCLRRYVFPVLLRDLEIQILVVIDQCSEIRAFKERLASKNCIKDHSRAENITLIVVAFVSEYLRGYISR